MNTLGFTIDANVEIPPLRGRLSKDQWTKWPFVDMNVGDSFFHPGVGTSASSAAREFAAVNHPKRFVTRTFESDPITKLPGTRVWRIR